MIFKSKLDTFVSQYFGSLRKKYLFLQKNFPSMLALLLFGFLVGNVFGTFLNTLRFFFIWDVFIIFILIGLLEVLNYTVYNAKNPLNFLSPFWPPSGPLREQPEPAAGACSCSASLSKKLSTRSDQEQTEGLYVRATETGRRRGPFRSISRTESAATRNLVPVKFVVQFLNFFKIGLMIGFFVDAFKVGS